MNKNELYEKLLTAFKDHSNKNTLQTTYVNRVLRIVKDYLQYDSLKQAIKILKDILGIQIGVRVDERKILIVSIVEVGEWFAIDISEEQYKLLKEVLDND